MKKLEQDKKELEKLIKSLDKKREVLLSSINGLKLEEGAIGKKNLEALASLKRDEDKLANIKENIVDGETELKNIKSDTDKVIKKRKEENEKIDEARKKNDELDVISENIKKRNASLTEIKEGLKKQIIIIQDDIRALSERKNKDEIMFSDQINSMKANLEKLSIEAKAKEEKNRVEFRAMDKKREKLKQDNEILTEIQSDLDVKYKSKKEKYSGIKEDIKLGEAKKEKMAAEAAADEKKLQAVAAELDKNAGQIIGAKNQTEHATKREEYIAQMFIKAGLPYKFFNGKTIRP